MDGRMTVSPSESLIYGGDKILLVILDDVELVNGEQVYIVFGGRAGRHVVIAKPMNEHSFLADIPVHPEPEAVTLTLYSRDRRKPEGVIRPLDLSCAFIFHADSAYYLARHLVSAVYEPGSLGKAGEIRGEAFDLLDEDYSTLDVRLVRAFKHIGVPKEWNVLGVEERGEPCETLLHFSARIGLAQFTRHLLDLPGGIEALGIPNKEGQLARDVAATSNLSEYLTNYDCTGPRAAVSANYLGDSPLAPTYTDTAYMSGTVSSSPTVSASGGTESTVNRPATPSHVLDDDIHFLHELIEQMETTSGTDILSVVSPISWPDETTNTLLDLSTSKNESLVNMAAAGTIDIQEPAVSESPQSQPHSVSSPRKGGEKSRSRRRRSKSQLKEKHPADESSDGSVLVGESGSPEGKGPDTVDDESPSQKGQQRSERKALGRGGRTGIPRPGAPWARSGGGKPGPNLNRSLKTNNGAQMESTELGRISPMLSSSDLEKTVTTDSVDSRELYPEIPWSRKKTPSTDAAGEDSMPALGYVLSMGDDDSNLQPVTVRSLVEEVSSRSLGERLTGDQVTASSLKNRETLQSSDELKNREDLQSSDELKNRETLQSSDEEPALISNPVDNSRSEVSPGSKSSTDGIDTGEITTISLIQGNIEELERMRRGTAAELEEERKGKLSRFSTSCPALDNDLIYDNKFKSVGPYKSLLDVTHEEEEEEEDEGRFDSDDGRNPSDFGSDNHLARLNEPPFPISKLEGTRSVGASLNLDKGIPKDSGGFEARSSVRPKSVDFSETVMFVVPMFDDGAGCLESGDGKEKLSRRPPSKRSFSLGGGSGASDYDDSDEGSDDSDSCEMIAPIDIQSPTGGVRPDLGTLGPSSHKVKAIKKQSDNVESLSETSSSGLLKQKRQIESRNKSPKAAPLSTSLTTNLNKSRSVSTPSIGPALLSPGDFSGQDRTVLPSDLFSGRTVVDSSPFESLELCGSDNELLDPRINASPPTHQMLQELCAAHDPGNVKDTATSAGSTDSKKEKKNRKSSVFARLGNSRLASVRKGGKKSSKSAVVSLHQFVAVRLPKEMCSHCSKLLSGKADYQCSVCLLNFHEDCRDKALACSSQRTDKKSLSQQSSMSSLKGAGEDSSSLSSTTGAPRPLSTAGLLSSASTSIVDAYSISMESLDDVGIGVMTPDCDDSEDRELTMMLTQLEAECSSWSESMDKKSLKKLNTKYIARQDNIWELIATERSYLHTLKIMRDIFARGLTNHVGLEQAAVDKIFPRLDDLIDLHTTFTSRLSERQYMKVERSVDHIGDVLLRQFGGASGERMKGAYGRFCSRHMEAVEFFKLLHKTDRKLQQFVRRCRSRKVTKRREVGDLILVVTQRLSKYKTLLENIIKNTKESKDRADREETTNALDLTKEILNHVDATVAMRERELRLMTIFNRTDPRSSATYNGDLKFQKSDLLQRNRKLRHAGALMWRNAREKEVEVLAVVLSDMLILFKEEGNGKFTFFSQDGKPSVVPLVNLLVREKGSTKDNRGIYLIRQSRSHPEMYEMVCKSAQERREWVEHLRQAVSECPEEDEGVTSEEGGENREALEMLGKVRQQLELLELKDTDLASLCLERSQILSDLIGSFEYEERSNKVVINSSYIKDNSGELLSSATLVQLALNEAQQLEYLLCGECSVLDGNGGREGEDGASSLGRSWSSVGERQSPSYQHLALPRRADTFGGFDQDTKPLAMAPLSAVRDGSVEEKMRVGESGSLSSSTFDMSSAAGVSSAVGVSSDTSSTVSGPPAVSLPSEPSESENKVKEPRSVKPASLPFSQRPSPPVLSLLIGGGVSRGSLAPTSPYLGGGLTRGMEDVDSGRDSLVTLSNMAGVRSVRSPPREQATALRQLQEYLHGILLSVSKGDTAFESLKLDLAEANIKVKQLTSEWERSQLDKKLALKHNKQMEEIRNLHEQISKERQQWEAEKAKDRQILAAEHLQIEELQKHYEKQEKLLLQARVENEAEVTALREQMAHFTDTPPFQAGCGTPRDSDLNKRPSDVVTAPTDLAPSSNASSSPSVSHRRSQSAELTNTLTTATDTGENPQEQTKEQGISPDFGMNPAHYSSLTEPLNASSSLKSRDTTDGNTTTDLSSRPNQLVLSQRERYVDGGRQSTASSSSSQSPSAGPAGLSKGHRVPTGSATAVGRLALSRGSSRHTAIPYRQHYTGKQLTGDVSLDGGKLSSSSQRIGGVSHQQKAGRPVGFLPLKLAESDNSGKVTGKVTGSMSYKSSISDPAGNERKGMRKKGPLDEHQL